MKKPESLVTENKELKNNEPPAEVKICKFLEGTDILVAADLDGYIVFWCVTSSAHKMKNKALVAIRDETSEDFEMP